ncbi:hypothetical protein [Polyangium sp. 15x6]|uniref:hypothetical protein n=1 Tax=Polyangium sp. 15x6 TaxID=3042687 RepID=UPI00249AB499|nr:hypothetical protein [Polyangium sp. 15x6]MDI3291845.1 hypothetical protein [Polyangium sp. 15x6]
MKRLLIMAALCALGQLGCGSDSSSNDDGSSSNDDSCSASNPCTSGTCVYPPGDCSSNAKGSCVEILQCDGPPPGPTCQCDGTVLENPDATCSPSGPRPTADLCQTGTFACGDITCKRNLEVCVATSGGAMPTTTHACAALSEIDNTCVNGIPDCACLQPAECGGASCCSADADHQETITINAP